MATHPQCIYNVTYQLVCFSGGYFADSPKSRLEQWYQWRVPIGDLGLLPLPLWPTNKAWAIVWAPTGVIAAPIMPQMVPAAHPTHHLCKLY